MARTQQEVSGYWANSTRRWTWRHARRGLLGCGLAAMLLLAGCKRESAQGTSTIELLNVSYDPTREFYADVNASFAKDWQATHQQRVNIKQSHGGSGKQARAVIDGLEADVVTLALGYDIDAIANKSALLSRNWQTRFPHNSAPYTSTVVFLVRRGNPKQIRDWNDLVKPGVQVITPNPKTSGGARWNYLAAWAFGLQSNGNDESKARAFVTDIYRHVSVLDSGARGATTTFVERKIGDVLLAWENEAKLCLRNLSGELELVMPSLSILAEPPVALVDGYAKKHHTEEVSRAYLEFLFSEPGQRLAMKHFYRPRDVALLATAGSEFPPIELVTIDQPFGGWAAAQKKHFDEGGEFDQIYKSGRP